MTIRWKLLRFTNLQNTRYARTSYLQKIYKHSFSIITPRNNCWHISLTHIIVVVVLVSRWYPVFPLIWLDIFKCDFVVRCAYDMNCNQTLFENRCLNKKYKIIQYLSKIHINIIRVQVVMVRLFRAFFFSYPDRFVKCSNKYYHSR